MKAVLFLLAIALSIAVSRDTAASEKIYVWTDENGVRHFSNDPPDNSGVAVEERETQSSSVPANESDQTRRNTYDRMVKESKAQSKIIEQQRRREEAALEEQRKKEAQLKRQAEISEKTEKIRKQIMEIRNRGLSRTFTQGMKDSRIEALEKQIEAIEKNAPLE